MAHNFCDVNHQVAIEKLLLAVQYNTPREVKEGYKGGLNGPDVKRVTRPEDAVRSAEHSSKLEAVR